jgi:hypothetical protein
MVLTSVESILFATTCTQLQTEILANKSFTGFDTPGPPVEYDVFSYIAIKNIFSCLLKASGLNISYAASDTTIFISATASEQDFIYKQSTNEYTANQLYLVLSRYTLDEGNWIEGYVENILANFFIDYDGSTSAQPVIVNFLNSLQLMMDLDYSNGRHIINLRQRGRAYTGTVTLGGLIESEVNICSDLKKSGYQAFNNHDSTRQIWFSDLIDTNPHSIPIPSGLSIDVGVPVVLQVRSDGSHTVSNMACCPYAFVSTCYEWFHHPYNYVDGIKYWNYEAAVYITASLDSVRLLEESIAGYLFHRFHLMFRAFTRKYGSMKVNNGSTNSHSNAVPHMRTSFDDGTGSKTYYANRVIKIASENKLQVDWLKE